MMKSIFRRVFIALFLVSNAVTAEGILQYFGTTWSEMERRIPELAERGYDSLWLPPPFKAGAGTYSVGFETLDRFELGEAGCGYVLPMNNATLLEIAKSHPHPAEGAAQGNLADVMMKIGAKGGGGIRRLIIQQRAGMKEVLILVPRESFEELSALEVTDLDRHCWVSMPTSGEIGRTHIPATNRRLSFRRVPDSFPPRP